RHEGAPRRASSLRGSRGDRPARRRGPCPVSRMGDRRDELNTNRYRSCGAICLEGVDQPQPETGSTANTYVIVAKLATGGMAEIFLAHSASAAGIERHVVLKRVLPARARDAVFVQMFLDEARVAAQLQHPNIAQVYDTGVLGDSYFFTMEYV